MLKRMLRAAMLDPLPYREARDDNETVLQSLGVVLLAAIAFGLAQRDLQIQDFEGRQYLVVLLAASTLVTGWLIWASVTWVLGTLLLRGSAGFRPTLRALGMAYGPAILTVFADVPGIGPTVFLIGILWPLSGGMVAVRETQGYDWVRAFVAAAIGWFAAFMVVPSVLLGGAVPST